MAKYQPYSQNTVELTLNSEDSIYTSQGGEYSLLNLVQLGTNYSAGFLGSLTLGVEANETDTSSTSSTTATSSSTGSVDSVIVVGASILSVVVGGFLVGFVL
jgi:hypothetical protein